jgi:hypothetical protein
MVLAEAYLRVEYLKAMFEERQVGYSICKQKMTSFRGQASWTKVTSPGGKLLALGFHLTKIVNKTEELNYLSTNIA